LKLDELSKEIEKLMKKLIEVSEGKSFSDEAVVKVSQELDILLVKYQRILNPNKKEDNDNEKPQSNQRN
jgi:hypothetical protein